MDYLWYTLSAICLICGLLGCIIPVLPGPPLAYVGLLFLHFSSKVEFSTTKLIVGAILSLVVVVVDQVIPMIGAKKFGGTNSGMWGCTIGAIVGIFIPPWGFLLGPLLGAIAGELIGSNPDNALKAGFGAFLGFLCGTVMKCVICVVFFWWVILELGK